MRFLKADTRVFHDLSDEALTKLKNGYAILSHRWREGEVLYKDLGDADSPAALSRAGYSKFKSACSIVKDLGYEFIWIDTCCINQDSLTDVSEAINSMYRLYSLSDTCITYLQDVTCVEDIDQSEWFDRGWTLQELIAPKTVQFYGRDWNLLGDKNSLETIITKRTGIPREVLNHTKTPQAYSIAQRMSWAAKRSTSRVEDRAYSLLGLFNVYMSVMYRRTGTRLHESIFMWDMDILEGSSTRDSRGVSCGLLAPSPASFARCRDVMSTGRSRNIQVDSYSVSESLPCSIYTLGTYKAVLKARRGGSEESCAVLLTQLRDGTYARTTGIDGESTMMVKNSPRSLMVKEFFVPLLPTEMPPRLYHGFWLRQVSLDLAVVPEFVILKRRLLDEEDRLMLPEGRVGTAGILMLTAFVGNRYGWIKLGFDSDCHPVCLMAFPKTYAEQKDLEVQYHDLLPLRQWQDEDPLKLQNQPIFDDLWTTGAPQGNILRRIDLLGSFDSRMRKGDPAEGFSFDYHGLQVSATKVPDLRPTSISSESNLRGPGQVWAIDICSNPQSLEQFKKLEASCCCLVDGWRPGLDRSGQTDALAEIARINSGRR